MCSEGGSQMLFAGINLEDTLSNGISSRL